MNPHHTKRWIVKQWNLRRRAFFLWRQKIYARCVEFYIVERTIWQARSGKLPTAHRNSTRIVKPSRQLTRAIGRKFHKLNHQQQQHQQEKRK